MRPRWGPIRAPRRASLLALGTIACVVPTVVSAQPAGGGCTLVMQPTGRTESVSIRVGGETDAYITHVWGGMRWTCGTATMTADSAVRYDLERRVEMFGTVRYRDTIRTLESDQLDFFEDEDRMVATGDVLLTRLASGSTLRGPQVTFLRAVSGIAERTTATGRPHLILLPEPGEEGKPVDVDADRVDMFGERLAWAWGGVIIQRPDVDAEADSAFFDMDAGNGILYGSARARREDLELEGDSIRLYFTEEELEEVQASGSGRAIGEEFELASDEIRARLANSELDQVWAFGAGRSLAASASYILGADSLRIAATAGRLDSIMAVGAGSAIEAPTADLAAGEPARTTEGGNWVEGDTLVFVFSGETAGAAAAGGSTREGAAADSSEEHRIERLLAIGAARSLYHVPPPADQPGPASHNYLIGQRIEVEFRNGEARRVSAERAIGVYLEPGGQEAAAPERGEAEPAAPADDQPADDQPADDEPPPPPETPPVPPDGPGDEGAGGA